MNWAKKQYISYKLHYIFQLKEEQSIETSSYAWIDASFDQYHFHRDGAFEFDWGLVIKGWQYCSQLIEECKDSEGTQLLFWYFFWHFRQSFIDQNTIMWLSEDVGHNIGQGQSTAQSLILSIFCILSSVTGIPLGSCALSIWKQKDP